MTTAYRPFQPLAGRHIVLGISGSIAAYKAADLASKLTQHGALVDVVLTEGASRFVTAVTFAALTQRPVIGSLFEANSPINIDHVALALEADAVIIAPATANTIARLALGISDDALTATVLATAAPVIVAPAMDAHMWENPATQANVEALRKRGVHVAGPAVGRMASGLSGAGRMEEPASLIGHLRMVLGRNGDYAGRRVVVSAGGTQEPLDPVRFLTNRSSGKMGYAIAEAARDRGAAVTLVSTPVALAPPIGVDVIPVSTALEMKDAIIEVCGDADVLVMAAAVSDFRPARPSGSKLKKDGRSEMALSLTVNPDIITAASGKRLVKVAFAAETGDVLEEARAKLVAKGAQLVVGNDVTEDGAGFGSDTNRVVLVGADGASEELPLMDKLEVAHRVLDRARPLLRG